MPIPLAVAMIPSAFQAISGLFQAGKGNRALRNLKRPKYEIPNEVRSQVGISKRLANSNMAGYGLAQQNIGLSQANMIEATRQGAGGGLGNVATIQAGSNQAYQQLGAQNSQYNVQMQENLKSSLGMLAQYKDKQWQLNKFAPYKDAYNRAQGQIQGGNQNINTGLSGASSLLTAKLQADAGANTFEKYFGKSQGIMSYKPGNPSYSSLFQPAPQAQGNSNPFSISGNTTGGGFGIGMAPPVNNPFGIG